MGFYSASPGKPVSRIRGGSIIASRLIRSSACAPCSKKKPSLSTSRSARPIDRMVEVQRPPIQFNVTAKPARLDHPRSKSSAPFAQAHERTEPEFTDAPVRRQRSLDRTGGLNKGEFLAHRNVHRSEDETANPTIEGTG